MQMLEEDMERPGGEQQSTAVPGLSLKRLLPFRGDLQDVASVASFEGRPCTVELHVSPRSSSLIFFLVHVGEDCQETEVIGRREGTSFLPSARCIVRVDEFFVLCFPK